MAKKRLPSRALNDARNDLVKKIYGGNDPQTLYAANQAINKALHLGAGAASPELMNFLNSGVSDYLKNDIEQVRNNELRFASNPNSFVNEILSELRSKDLPSLSNAELEDVLSTYQEIDSMATPTTISLTTQSSRNGPIYDFVPISMVGSQYQKPDLAAGIKAIQDLLKDRKFVADEEAKVQALQAEIPQLLKTQRDQFYDQQQEFAKDYITGEYAPQVLEQLNRRGLADSGEFGAFVGSKFNEINSTIEQAKLNQENEEVNFWANQAYQNTLNQLIQSRIGVAEQVSNIRSDALTKSSQNFQRTQADIQNRFNLDLFKNENERALSIYQKQTQMNNDKARREKEASAIGNVGASIGTVVGGIYGGPAGASAGNTAGGSIGKNIG